MSSQIAASQEMPNETFDWASAAQRLQKQAEQEHPEAWIADENDSEFVGIFRKLRRAPSKFGMAPVAVFEDQAGTLRSVWLHHTVLRNALYELQPKPGELVLIRYTGREMKEDGTDYANYRVAVDRPNDQGLSWADVMRGPTEEELVARSTPVEPQADMTGAHGDDDIPF